MKNGFSYINDEPRYWGFTVNLSQVDFYIVINLGKLCLRYSVFFGGKP